MSFPNIGPVKNFKFIKYLLFKELYRRANSTFFIYFQKVIKRINGHNHGSSSKEVVLKRLKALVKIKALQTNFHPDLVIRAYFY